MATPEGKAVTAAGVGGGAWEVGVTAGGVNRDGGWEPGVTAAGEPGVTAAGKPGVAAAGSRRGGDWEQVAGVEIGTLTQGHAAFVAENQVVLTPEMQRSDYCPGRARRRRWGRELPNVGIGPDDPGVGRPRAGSAASARCQVPTGTGQRRQRNVAARNGNVRPGYCSADRRSKAKPTRRGHRVQRTRIPSPRNPDT